MIPRIFAYFKMTLIKLQFPNRNRTYYSLKNIRQIFQENAIVADTIEDSLSNVVA